MPTSLAPPESDTVPVTFLASVSTQAIELPSWKAARVAAEAASASMAAVKAIATVAAAREAVNVVLMIISPDRDCFCAPYRSIRSYAPGSAWFQNGDHVFASGTLSRGRDERVTGTVVPWTDAVV